MPLESIVDAAVRIKPSVKLIDFITKNARDANDAPIGVVSLIEASKKSKREIASVTLKIEDLRWLSRYLAEYRKSATEKVYMHELFDDSDVILPSPEVTPRNPELEARIQKLKAQQNAREYQAMTKSIDSARKFLPEDSISYQMKQINRQLIAVAQFVFSVIAGFAFGFIGVELVIGNLDFGFRLLLGIICGLIIALAEIYFLALKLNEYDFDTLATPKAKKLHQD
ncbi:PREDICTED: transmembrane protein 199 [Dinoponera quadriceps]|uniref:Transmembrane protein 199 n=1 Tax=Dinoponera quadriceps TaxID=609295 RepID=A0A6P3X2C7_DINQU|nr:PREDICTED: transmembrane protein 199 [Dinoponera quadriceps]